MNKECPQEKELNEQRSIFEVMEMKYEAQKQKVNSLQFELDDLCYAISTQAPQILQELDDEIEAHEHKHKKLKGASQSSNS